MGEPPLGFMFDALSFFEGFALDAAVLTVVGALLVPWIISRWINRNLMDVVEDLMADPRMNALMLNFVQKRLAGMIGGNLGGRPKGLKGIFQQIAGSYIERFIANASGGNTGGEDPTQYLPP